MKEARLIYRQPANTPDMRIEPRENTSGVPERKERMRTPDEMRSEAAARIRQANESAEVANRALFDDLDAQDNKLNGRIRDEGFDIRDNAEPAAEFEGREAPSGESTVRAAGPRLRGMERALGADQKQKRELEKFAAVDEIDSNIMSPTGWGPIEKYGKTDGKFVYIYKKVNGELFAYTPRLGLQVLDPANGKWYYVYNMEGGKESRGRKRGAMKPPALTKIYLDIEDGANGQNSPGLNMNDSAKRIQYENNTYLEENFLKPAFFAKPGERMRFDQFFQGAPPKLWETEANADVLRRFRLLYAMSNEGGSVDDENARVDIRERSGENLPSGDELGRSLSDETNEVATANERQIKNQELIGSMESKIRAVENAMNEKFGDENVARADAAPETGTFGFLIGEGNKTYAVQFVANYDGDEPVFNRTVMEIVDGSRGDQKRLSAVEKTDDFSASTVDELSTFIKENKENNDEIKAALDKLDPKVKEVAKAMKEELDGTSNRTTTLEIADGNSWSLVTESDVGPPTRVRLKPDREGNVFIFMTGYDGPDGAATEQLNSSTIDGLDTDDIGRQIATFVKTCEEEWKSKKKK